jgi:hypothetical protein
MANPEPLQYGLTYHIFNRGNNGETIFREERNYRHFLQLYAHHVSTIIGHGTFRPIRPYAPTGQRARSGKLCWPGLTVSAASACSTNSKFY